MQALGAIYGETECVIEKYRAKSDMNNAVYAGCVTGGALGRSGVYFILFHFGVV
jgi:hypothetical protein